MTTLVPARQPAQVALARAESAAQRRRRVRRCLGLLRRDLADDGWEHATVERAAFPTREVLAEESRVLRAEVLRQAAVIEEQWKRIAELRDALGCDVIVMEGKE